MTKQILAADLGGTSSRFSHFELSADGTLRQIGSTWLKTKDTNSFAELLQQLEKSSFSLKREEADINVFAVAGPIERGVYSKPPNIAWTVDLTDGGKSLGLKRFALINDFLAQAFSCLTHLGAEAIPIIPGARVERRAIAVIGAGTGLGKAMLFPDGLGGYIGAPSEGGHTNLPVENQRELEFSTLRAKELEAHYITLDDVVCGRGLSSIHEFLTGKKLSPQEVAATFSEENETLRWAATFYGRVCRNFALESLAFGGVFIAGGVAAKNPILVKHRAFREAFHDSRVHRRVLENIPVSLIDNEESGLWGAASFGVQELMRGSSRQ